MTGVVQVVVGGQFGSEAKGHVCDKLARRDDVALGVRVAGPNAGHTVYDNGGTAHALRHIPVTACSTAEVVALAAGSEIDLEVLHQEWEEVGSDNCQLVIDPQATVMQEYHAAQEKLLAHGSTHKGIGAARADRLMRQASIVRDLAPRQLPRGSIVAPVDFLIREYLDFGTKVQIEGTQGYGLGLHAGYYPHCTSSDCRNIDFLAMAGAGVAVPLETWVTVRTYPIRVAGNSGPFGGGGETTWAEIGQEPEYTTVTKKERRVGHWDGELVRRAIQANGGRDFVNLALTFLDYWYPNDAGVTEWSKLSYAAQVKISEISREYARVGLVGTGPTTMVEVPVLTS